MQIVVAVDVTALFSSKAHSQSLLLPFKT